MAIWLNEDYEHFFVRYSLEDMTQEGLERQVDFYHKAGAGGIFFCVNAQCAYYESRIYDTAWSDVIRKEDGNFYHRGTLISDKPLPTLRNTIHAKAACDNTSNRVFQIRIDRCRHHGMKGGLSIRMNDCHLTGYPDSPMHSDFWFNNPRYRLSDGGLDYGEKAVREEMKGLITEVLELFDPDALELDWMRTPPFFRDGHEDEGHIYADEMVRHAYMEKCKAEKRRGHPVQLFVRVPSRVEDALALGLDVISWAKNSWIDSVIGCAFILSTDSSIPQRVWRTLLPETVSFIPGMDVLTTSHKDSCGIEGIVKTLELQTGYAAVFYHGGAKDLYMFNHFFAAVPGADQESYLRKLKSVSTPENARNGARRHAATLCCNLVPGATATSSLPLRAETNLQKVRINVGDGLKGRKIRVLFAFTSAGILQGSDFEFQVNEIPCKVCSDVGKYPLPGKSRHYDIPDQQWQSFVCEVPEDAVTDGIMIAGFRAVKDVDALLHWCEFDVEKLF